MLYNTILLVGLMFGWAVTVTCVAVGFNGEPILVSGEFVAFGLFCAYFCTGHFFYRFGAANNGA